MTLPMSFSYTLPLSISPYLTRVLFPLFPTLHSLSQEKSHQLSVSTSQEVVSLRLEKESLLAGLRESSAELTKLNVENQSLIEEQVREYE